MNEINRLRAFLESKKFDFLSSFESLKEKHGTVRWMGFSDVIEIPIEPLFAYCNQTFMMDLKNSPKLAAEYFFCYFSHLSDAQKNHIYALDNLSAVLGAPLDISDSKSLSHRWEDREIALKITSWPNHQGAPELQHKTMISVENLTPKVVSQSEINNLLCLAHGFRDDNVWFSFDFDEFKNYPTGYAREIIFRNENPLPGLEKNHLLFWKTVNEVGLLTTSGTFRIPRSEVIEFRHTILDSGKLPGESYVTVKFNSDGANRTVKIINGRGPNDLDDLVIHLSKNWAFNFIMDEGTNDG